MREVLPKLVSCTNRLAISGRSSNPSGGSADNIDGASLIINREIPDEQGGLFSIGLSFGRSRELGRVSVLYPVRDEPGRQFLNCPFVDLRIQDPDSGVGKAMGLIGLAQLEREADPTLSQRRTSCYR